MSESGKTNMSIGINDGTYQKLSRELPHGHKTQLVQKFIDNIERLIDEDNREEYLKWLYAGKELILK